MESTKGHAHFMMNSKEKKNMSLQVSFVSKRSTVSTSKSEKKSYIHPAGNATRIR